MAAEVVPTVVGVVIVVRGVTALGKIIVIEVIAVNGHRAKE